MKVQQLVREWPPGFGGVERVAHELASTWQGEVFSLDVQRQSFAHQDPLDVNYTRIQIQSIKLFGRLYLPLPCSALFRLLLSSDPLHGHLPCPGVLLLLFLARILKPNRKVTAHWHCFLDPDSDFQGFLISCYQWIALRFVPHLTAVITTSSCLASELNSCGVPRRQIFVLPCCLCQKQELMGLALPFPVARSGEPLRVLFIGRLDSYKRLDLLFEALSHLSSPWKLAVVGDGPNRFRFEGLAQCLFSGDAPVHFYGRLSESAKLNQLATADLLVLPSDRSNEAFGIVQLEAMAAGRLALAFDRPRSGMGWVGRLSGLPWSQAPEGLVEVLQRLADQPALRQQLSVEARHRYLTVFARRVWLHQLRQFSNFVERGKLINPVE